MAAGGEMELWSPSPNALSISPSIHQCGSDWLGGAYVGLDCSKDVDITGEGNSYQCLGNEGSTANLRSPSLQDHGRGFETEA